MASLISCYAQVLPFKVSALLFFEDSGSGAAAPADSHIFRTPQTKPDSLKSCENRPGAEPVVFEVMWVSLKDVA